MKTFAIIVILTALFLLFRIAYQKPATSSKTKEDLPPEEPVTDNGIVGKSTFVRSARSQLAPNADSLLNAENQIEKANIFATETPKNDAVIPPGELDEVFDYTVDLDIPPDDEDDEIDVEEEAGELRQMLGNDAAPASGFTTEEMADAINNPSDEKAAVLCQIGQTDLFEQLVSLNAGKALQIKAVIERHINAEPEKQEESNNGYGGFDIADYV